MEQDEILVQASRQGDLDGFNLLVDRYQGQVYNLALRVLHDHAAAEDATQETFVAAFRGLASYRGGSFRAWLMRIAVNRCHDELRRQRRRPAQSLDRPLGPEDQPPEVADPVAGPEDLALQRERGRALAGLLLDLPPDQRVAVVLSDVQGFSYEEIAAATGAGLGTVKSRLSRGRARLRDLLAGQGELFALPERPKAEGGAAGGGER
ncbi:MAG: sigma-70 family RNA polymerase sigma factor [Chloroflexi bacterium]|nr:sigma-70 family RNA polymerase sigma factor [Chloroflexota bacterium]